MDEEKKQKKKKLKGKEESNQDTKGWARYSCCMSEVMGFTFMSTVALDLIGPEVLMDLHIDSI